jgi:hypothetical protein
MNLKTVSMIVCCGILGFTTSAFGEPSGIEGTTGDVNGKPLKNAEVRLQQEKAKIPEIVVKTDSKGHFVAAHVPPGVYTVRVILDGAVKWSAAHVKANSGQVVHLSLNTNQLAVTNTAANTQPKKRAVWVQNQTGSRLGGHWEDEPVRGPNADNVDTMGSEQLRRLQNTAPAVPAGGR